MALGVSAIDKVVLGWKYDIQSRAWFLPALNQLARRAGPIGFEEAIHMGFDTALKLASARERLVLSTTHVTQRYCNPVAASLLSQRPEMDLPMVSTSPAK
ncbi:hypothetical protein EDD17DRAFT_1051341 [Pisolithus thermaeus]|nr:hypothetical protein EV401DRAFT_1960876 [Pisolithus croceorrhizus]KAI6156332.1 hypothetical protein EDD17DRAFT_1051341 [Pisolithus thermaeus]